MHLQWANDLLARDFRPAMVEEITGYSQTLQRKWAERYLNFRQMQVYGGQGDHRWFSWVGVQMIAIFGDVLTDLGSAAEACAAATLSDTERLQRNGVEQFQYDRRSSGEGGDLYLIRDFERTDIVFLRSGEKALNLGSRNYLYNFSAMQRRVFEQLAAFDQSAAALREAR